MRRAKALIVTNYAPPMSTGSPLMLGRLLEGMPKDSYVLLTNRLSTFLSQKKISAWLPCLYYFLGEKDKFTAAKLNKLPPIPPEAAPRSTLITAPFDVLKIYRQASKIIKQEAITCVLTTSDMGLFLIGGYWAAKRAKIPLAIYLFDLYAGNAYAWPIQMVARFMEPRMFHYAKHIFVTNRHTQEYLCQKYALPSEKFVISPHPAPDLKTYHTSDSSMKDKIKRIVYTGAIYWAQLPCLQDLVKATNNMPNVTVEIYGPLTSQEFSEAGLVGTNVITGLLPHEEAIKRLRQADILFLPMAFDGPSKSILATAAPGKIAEYLAIGQPILVYAPDFSHTARYAKEEGFALVVDSQNGEELKHAIERLLTDKKLTDTLLTHANQTLRHKHDLKTIRHQFQSVLLS